MNPENAILIDKVSGLFPFIITIVAISIGGWIITTWLRIKNGYPLDGAWGQALHPRTDKEAMERIKLLTGENAQLRAEIGSMKDRLETIERIVTDQPLRLAKEIDQLAIDKGGHA
ncbi:MAG: hypothetical protein ACJ8E8_07710 [Sphingomicrobium sp.]|jgi:hypothetical protein